jgi:predicted nucleic acid-binding protein
MPVAVDTNVLVGRTLKRDQYHEDATEVVGIIDKGEVPVAHVNSYVIAETMNLVGGRAGKGVAVELYDTLVESAGFELRHATKKDFQEADAVHRKYDSLSFVDSVTVAYMRREDIECLYSFDDGFDAVGSVTRLADAVVPR